MVRTRQVDPAMLDNPKPRRKITTRRRRTAKRRAPQVRELAPPELSTTLEPLVRSEQVIEIYGAHTVRLSIR